LGWLDVGRLDPGPMVGQRVSFAERLPALLSAKSENFHKKINKIANKHENYPTFKHVTSYDVYYL
jgi:hypothetical protein